MHDFIKTIFYWFQQAIPFAAFGLAGGVVILFLLNWKCRREGKNFPKGQAAAILLLVCYLGGLAAVTFMNRMDGMRTGFQLYPLLAFWEAWNSFTLQTWLNPLLNIAMFIPLGVFLPLAARSLRRWYRMLLMGAGISLGIELLQYMLGRGQADIDDLICNTLGAMLGYCYCLFFCISRKETVENSRHLRLFPDPVCCCLCGCFPHIPLTALREFSRCAGLCCGYQRGQMGAGM